MKFTLSTGMPGLRKNPDVHTLAIVRSVYMAPLGVPVLPEVYMIMARRSSLPSVKAGPADRCWPRSTTSSTVLTTT
ncbi:hypothetical protein ATCCBAA256_27230 [Mycobacterium montefiorense]|nr:hypothetical protein ATCCBAA256_27230 [Mycobacterium montefiorense]